MNKKSVTYLQCTGFLQVTFTENTGCKNLSHAASDFLFLSPHQAEYKLMWENLTLLCMLNMNGWVALLKETLN
jgi:hypothetical protein